MTDHAQQAHDRAPQEIILTVCGACGHMDTGAWGPCTGADTTTHEPVNPTAVHYYRGDEDSAGAECSRLESDLMDIHDALEAAGLPAGAINANSILERIALLTPLTPTWVVRGKPAGESIQDTWFHETEPYGTENARTEAHQFAAQTGRRLEKRWTTPWHPEPIDRSVS